MARSAPRGVIPISADFTAHRLARQPLISRSTCQPSEKRLLRSPLTANKIAAIGSYRMREERWRVRRSDGVQADWPPVSVRE